MPQFTVYADIERKGKRRHRYMKVAVHEFSETPISLSQLQDEFWQAAKNVYEQYEQPEVTLEIFRHLTGKYIMRMTSYRQSKVRYNREPQAFAKVTYNPKDDTAKIQNIIFESPAFFESFKFEADVQREGGIKCELKEIVPDSYETMLHNPDSIYFNLLMVKSHSYGNTPPIGDYGQSETSHHVFGAYGVIPRENHGSHDEAVLEKDRIERDNRL
jgi:hypothetical protein